MFHCFDNASVGERDIDLALLRFDHLIKPVEVLKIGNVPLNCRDVRSDFGSGLIQFSLSSSRDEDISSLSDEPFGGCQADPAIAPCDDGHPPLALA